MGKRYEEAFHQKRDTDSMATKQMKRCLTSLAIRENQIKSIVRYHCIPIRTAKIQSSENTKCC